VRPVDHRRRGFALGVYFSVASVALVALVVAISPVEKFQTSAIGICVGGFCAFVCFSAIVSIIAGLSEWKTDLEQPK
jgi:hypothetical protein